MTQKKHGLIVCGTDTDVGKTVVSALLVQGLKGMYWKPIQSGLKEGGDTGFIVQLLGLPKQRLVPELVQDEFTPEAISELAIPLLEDKTVKSRILEGYKRLRELLGKPGVTQRAAKEILNFVDK